MHQKGPKKTTKKKTQLGLKHRSNLIDVCCTVYIDQIWSMDQSFLGLFFDHLSKGFFLVFSLKIRVKIADPLSEKNGKKRRKKHENNCCTPTLRGRVHPALFSGSPSTNFSKIFRIFRRILMRVWTDPSARVAGS